VLFEQRNAHYLQVKGVGVAPAELEDALLGHSKVFDAAVTGVPDDYAGEVPKAYIVPQLGITANNALAAELHNHIQQTKSKSKWLKGGIEFVQEIPKSASGKILRRKLRQIETDRAKAKRSARTSRL
jgi:4-coumarate--CoA ligase